MSRRAFCFVLPVLLFLLPRVFAAGMPGWAQGLAVPDPAPWEGSPDAVILLDEETSTYGSDGYLTVTSRRAVQLLANLGDDWARAKVPYYEGQRQVEEADCWLVRKGEVLEHLPRRKWADISDYAPGAIIDESRALIPSLKASPVVGDLFLFEVRYRTRALFAADEYRFPEGPAPVLLLRRRVEAPPTARIEFRAWGRPAEIKQTASSVEWTWRYLPFTPIERLGPLSENGASFQILDGAATTVQLSSWNEVATYVLARNAEAQTPAPTIVAKAEALAPASLSAEEKARTLSHFVQNLRYVAINRDLHLGRGMQPRSPTETLQSGFGDCKDKSCLLIALLRASGVVAHPVIVWSSTTPVTPDASSLLYPTPGVFNHAIVAIDLPAEGTQPLRRAFFDPTDPFTLFGSLPSSDQGALALVADGQSGELIRLPVLPVATHRHLRRQVVASLQPDLSLVAKVTLELSGQFAASERASLALDATAAAQERSLRTYLHDQARSAPFTEASITPAQDTEGVTLQASLVLPRATQVLSPKKILLRLEVLDREILPVFPEKTRRTAIFLRGFAVTDEFRVALPAGWRWQEIPAGGTLESPFGSMRVTYTLDGEQLRIQRSLNIPHQEIGVDQFPIAKRFFAGAARLEKLACFVTPGS